jgi:hypothetical protein
MMAILVDLPNELFYAIGSHVNRAADKLHLFLVNNFALILKVRLLYEHLTVQHHFMMSLRCPVHQLASTLKSDTSNLGHVVRSFSFENSCECSEKHELINLLSLFTKTLKTITIIASANRGDIVKPSLFSPSKFAMALCCTTGH